MPDKVIEVPGVGNVAFPDSMSDDQISAAIRTQVGNKAQPASEDPGYWNTLISDLKNVPAGMIALVRHPLDTAKAAVGQVDFKNPENSSGLLGAVDVLGNEWEKGHHGEALAHLTELGLPIIFKGAGALAPKIGDAASAAGTAAGKVVDAATSPAARDVAGLVSPRLAHGLSLAGRVRRALQAFTQDEAAPTPATAPAAQPPAAATPAVATPPVAVAASPVTAPVSKPALTMKQAEAAMARKTPAPLESPQSTYAASGDLKSPQLRAAEIVNANRAAKAQRFAQALHAQGIDASDIGNIPMHYATPTQIAQGASPGWANIAELLGEKEPSSETVGAIYDAMQKLKQAESAVAKKPAALDLARRLRDEMQK